MEMRGAPAIGVHWNIREDFYHQLGTIDRMIGDRYGEERVPRRADGSLIKLADCFYSTDRSAGDVHAEEVMSGFDSELHIAGTIQHVEFIDDRWRIRQIEQATRAVGRSRATLIDSARCTRHSLEPLDHSDWRRLLLRNGREISEPLPPIATTHPMLRRDVAAAPVSAYRTSEVRNPSACAPLSVRHGVDCVEQNGSTAFRTSVLSFADLLVDALPVMPVADAQAALIRNMADEIRSSVSADVFSPRRFVELTDVLRIMMAAGCGGPVGEGIVAHLTDTCSLGRSEGILDPGSRGSN
ncbi:hypothetical protein [Plantactinospora sp. WMMB782]|uniref:hypothetical protein n=1 Tax=Plantactinospora sp. WMMB782 TaxID=3404121 RepID=UPI003B946A32